MAQEDPARTPETAAAHAAEASPAQERCRRMAVQVNDQLAKVRKVNQMRPCRDDQPVEQPRCVPLDIPRLAPWTSIRWGDSDCDCIENDDTEIMTITVCNPYANLTLANVMVYQVEVVRGDGTPVGQAEDGTPNIQLVPRGPYCFGDIPPCACVTREFFMELLRPKAGTYRILLKGICFEACFHGVEEDCFTFEVCKD